MSDAISAINRKHRAGKKGKQGAVREVRIRPAQGGHIVSVEHEPDADDMSYAPPSEQVFTDHDAMMAHVGKHLKK